MDAGREILPPQLVRTRDVAPALSSEVFATSRLFERERRLWVWGAMRYDFRTRDLLNRAFTHDLGSPQFNLERLEFLGDAVVGACALASALLPGMGERPNDKASRVSRLVSNSCLAARADELELDLQLVGPINRAHPEWLRVQNSPKSKADVIEAVFGAIFLDAGFSAAQRASNHFFGKELFEREIGLTPISGFYPGSDEVRGLFNYRPAVQRAAAIDMERLGFTLPYTFTEPNILAHAVFRNELHRTHQSRMNKTLQALGHAIYHLYLSEALVRYLPEYDPTLLSGARALHGRDAPAREYADRLGLSALVRNWLPSSNTPTAPQVEIAFEALVGGIFLDGGYRNAARFLDPLVVPTLSRFSDPLELRSAIGFDR